MSARPRQSQIGNTAQAVALPTQYPSSARPLFGGEINIRLAVTPGTITMVAVPATVLVTAVAGWVLLTAMGMPVFLPQMFAAGLVCTLGGTVAVIPLFFLMKHGVEAIAKAALLGIGLRCACTLMALLVAMGPGWGLERMPLVYWALACYFPLLSVETGVTAWLCQRAHH